MTSLPRSDSKRTARSLTDCGIGGVFGVAGGYANGALNGIPITPLAPNMRLNAETPPVLHVNAEARIGAAPSAYKQAVRGNEEGGFSHLFTAMNWTAIMNATVQMAVPVAVSLFGLVLLLWPDLLGGDNVGEGAGLTVLLIGLFVSRSVSDHIAAIAFFAGAMTIAAIPPAIAFAGFTTSGTWLVFGGMVLTAAIRELGLARQIAARILPRSGISYLVALLGIALVALGLVFVVPSTTARVLLLIPIVSAFSAQLGYAPHSRAAAGLVTMAILTTYYGATGIVTASLTNLSMVSLADALLHLPISYEQYFRAVFPILSLGTVTLLTGCVWFVYREAPSASPVPKSYDGFRRENLQLAPILLAALVLWATDSIHGIAPAWVALAAALLCLLGPARKLSLSDCVKFEVLILFAAFLSLGAVLNYTQTAQWLGNWLVENAPLRPDAHWTNLAIVTTIGTILSVATTNLAAPVLYTSLADALSRATGWPLDTVLLLGTPTWTFIPFVFQAPIIVIGMKMAGMPIVGITRFLLGFYCVCLPVLVPLHFLWVKHLGYLG